MAVQAKFPAYADFEWSNIQKYFAVKYPDWTEYNSQQINDQWTFDLPEKMTEASCPVRFANVMS
ncbi:Phospho-2-dehydro-3-deoxyheptonate aldolase, tyrosine-inhibited [Venturia inaequalis]|nr:Phospho-2-dehydro-3-deoxyheptonate aldolase, tyrosine-inhibited [Venturia inaequalis]